MTHLKLTILLLLLPTFAYSIDTYLKGDTLVVWADGGLSIRDTNTIKGNKIGLIPYGAKVVVLEHKIGSYQEEVIQIGAPKANYLGLRLEGQWTKVQYQNIIGYVFDGYLSRFEAPLLKTGIKDKPEWHQDYFERIFGLVSSRKGDGLTKHQEEFVFNEYFYGQGIYCKAIGTNVSNADWILPAFSLEEVILLVKNLKLALVSDRLNSLPLISDEHVADKRTRNKTRILVFESYLLGQGEVIIRSNNLVTTMSIWSSC